MFFILLDFQKDNVEQWCWRNKTHLHPRIPQNLSSESESGKFSIRCSVVNYQKFSQNRSVPVSLQASVLRISLGSTETLLRLQTQWSRSPAAIQNIAISFRACVTYQCINKFLSYRKKGLCQPICSSGQRFILLLSVRRCVVLKNSLYHIVSVYIFFCFRTRYLEVLNLCSLFRFLRLLLNQSSFPVLALQQRWI